MRKFQFFAFFFDFFRSATIYFYQDQDWWKHWDQVIWWSKKLSFKDSRFWWWSKKVTAAFLVFCEFLQHFCDFFCFCFFFYNSRTKKYQKRAYKFFVTIIVVENSYIFVLHYHLHKTNHYIENCSYKSKRRKPSSKNQTQPSCKEQILIISSPKNSGQKCLLD